MLYFEKTREQAEKDRNSELAMCARAELLVSELGLGFLFPWLEAYELNSRDPYEHPPSPRGDFGLPVTPPFSSLRLHLYIPLDCLPNIDGFHEYINRVDGPEWVKRTGLDKHYWGPNGSTVTRYEEKYRWNSEKCLWEGDLVEIIFYRTVEEGDDVNGCKVRRREPQQIKGDLTLECEKEKKA